MNVCQVFLQTLLTEGSLVMTNRGMKDTVHLPQANYLEYFPQFLLNNGICKKYLRHSPFSHRRRYHESSLAFCSSKRALCKALPPLPYGRQLLLCGDGGDGSGGRQDIPAEIFKSASRVSTVGGARIGWAVDSATWCFRGWNSGKNILNIFIMDLRDILIYFPWHCHLYSLSLKNAL